MILSYGDAVTIPLLLGHHRLRVHNTISRRRAEFDVAMGEHVRFSAANVRGKNFAGAGGVALFGSTRVLRCPNDPIPRRN